MANIKFVGFQEHFEIPETLELVEFQEVISCKLDRDQVFSLLSEPPLLSKWFYEIVSINSKPGGKVQFITDSGEKAEAICTSLILGKEISLVSSLFGDFSARIENKKGNLNLHVGFKIFTANPSGMKETFRTFIHNLSEISS